MDVIVERQSALDVHKASGHLLIEPDGSRAQHGDSIAGSR